MSTEQRDKAAEVLREAKRVRDRLVREANKPLDIEIVGSMGQMIDFLESAHAATMPDREALESNIKESLIASGWVDPSVIRPHWVVKWSAIAADAVLALLNKEGEE